MFEILAVIGVMGWFRDTAKRQGRNTVLWVLVGGAAYVIPALLLRVFLYPALISDYVTGDNYFALLLLGLGLSVGAGALSCLIARKALLSYQATDIARLDSQSEAERKARDLAGPSWGNEAATMQWTTQLRTRGYAVSPRRDGFAIAVSPGRTHYVYSLDDLRQFVKQAGIQTDAEDSRRMPNKPFGAQS